MIKFMRRSRILLNAETLRWTRMLRKVNPPGSFVLFPSKFAHNLETIPLPGSYTPQEVPKRLSRIILICRKEKGVQEGR
jgi:hypothetical protein